MIDAAAIPTSAVSWHGAIRIIRSVYPPIDLFEDVADPADWPLIISAEQKTNPRLVEDIGDLDKVPPGRRVGGAGASYLMAPFTHATTDRPSRFSDGSFGVLYAASNFETALLETMHHHGIFCARTNEPPGWTSQFREIVLNIEAWLHDLRCANPECLMALDPDSYISGQTIGDQLRNLGSDGVIYGSVRCDGGECAALFYPDCATNPVQGRHLDYHWNGARIDMYRDPNTGDVFRVVQP